MAHDQAMFNRKRELHARATGDRRRGMELDAQRLRADADGAFEQIAEIDHSLDLAADDVQRRVVDVRAGQPQRGIELLMREAEQEKSARARFLRRSEAAQIMVDAGLDPVAMPILRELLEQIQTYKLEEWEAGDAVARPMALLYRCLDKLGTDAELKENLYRQICRLDPVQAMSFSKSSSASTGTGASEGG